MSVSVLRLFPGPQALVPLPGLYLAHRLHQSPACEGPFLYTNFISSLDGRISLRDSSTGRRDVPAAIANAHDWGLYLELAAQADLLLTTSRHLRALAAERHGDVFALGTNAQYGAWRRQEKLSTEPAVAALSEGLDIPLEAVRAHYRGPLLIITGGRAPPARVAALRAAGVEVLQLPSGSVLDGQVLVKALGERGYRRIYSVAGPRITHALLTAGAIHRFYLTVVPVALGGREFDTFTLGETLNPPRLFALHELYFDSALPADTGQLFASFTLSTNRFQATDAAR